MRALPLALTILFVSPVAHASRAENLEKCRLMDRLPDANLAKIARASGTTVKAIRAACREIRRPARPSRPAPAPRTPRNPSRNDDSAPCQCGIGEICVRYYLGWKCSSPSGPDNRCSISGDCVSPGSRCENGVCTR